jgi:hypothetical protein
MNPNDIQRVLKTYLEREQASKTDTVGAIYASFFPKQRAFVMDPAKEKVARCGRRAGKSRGVIGGLVAEALSHQGCAVLYAGLTRKSAKRVGWKTLKKFNRDFDVGLTFHETDLIATTPAGSEICFIGLDDADAAEALRGESFRIIVLDEAASYGPNLKYVVEEVLTPMLMDEDGSLWWVGTPSAACAGPFFDANHNAEIPSYHWTCLDNPYIPNAAEWLKRHMRKMGWSAENPVYLREYMGQWIKDDSALIYKFDADKCRGRLAPEHQWNYILGVDLGYDDATAIVCVAFSPSSPNLYCVEEFKKARMLPSQVAEKVAEFQAKYSPSATVVDTGGLGKAIAEEMKQRYNIALKPAEKNKKFDYVELLNSDLFEGRIKFVPEVKALPSEMSMLQWDQKRKGEDPRFENHLCDAFLYAWRESGHWGYRRATREPAEGSKAWESEHERKLADKLQSEEKKPWWEKIF